ETLTKSGQADRWVIGVEVLGRDRWLDEQRQPNRAADGGAAGTYVAGHSRCAEVPGGQIVGHRERHVRVTGAIGVDLAEQDGIPEVVPTAAPGGVAAIAIGRRYRNLVRRIRLDETVA